MTDLVVTMQLQAKNTSIKIAYMTTESVLNKKSCFLVNGSSPIQSVLPDLTDFKVRDISTQLAHWLPSVHSR